MELLKLAWKDIRRGENLDLYITLIVAIILMVVNLLEISSIPLTPVLLSILTLLVVNSIVHRHRLDRIIEAISRTEKDFFLVELGNDQQKDIDRRVEKSKDLLIIGVSLGRTLESYYDMFERKLRKGDKIRVVLIDPDSPACKMTVQRRYVAIEFSDWHSQVISTLKSLERLKHDTSGDLEIHVTDFHVAHGGFLIDSHLPNGIIFLWYHSFKTRKANRPKFVLFPQDDYWYSYFLEESDAIWSNSIPWNRKQNSNAIDVEKQAV